MIYSFEEIARKVTPVAKKYGLPAVYLFGSYARNTATENSDIDLIVDLNGTSVRTLLDMSKLYGDLKNVLGKEIDIVTLNSLQQETSMQSEAEFNEVVQREKVNLYAAA